MPKLQSGLLYIKKRSLPQCLTMFIFMMPFFLSFAQDLLGVGSFIKYTIDLAWVVAIAFLFIDKRFFQHKSIRPFLIYTVIFLCYALLVYIFRFQSVIYFLWGFRNNFRFFFAFLLFAVMLDSEDADFCLKFIDGIFWINAVVTFVQFFVMGYSQDYLGGIFGVSRGCNSYSIIFFTIVIGMSLLRFMSRQENVFLCTAKCVVSLVISAMAELKFFFVIFMIIMIMSFFLTSFSWRKFLIVLVAVLIFSFSSTLIVELFGENNRITIDRIIELVTTENYATGQDLGRFAAVPTISRLILTEPLEKLFGLGLGNCDTSSFEICNTPFFKSHSALNYVWLSSAFWFLETGYTGLVYYISFYGLCFVTALISMKKPGANKLYCQLALIMSVACVLTTFYNSALRVESAYMVFFVLALPLIDRIRLTEEQPR